MKPPLLPIVFAPHFLAKPWGGRRMADLLHKSLPPGVPVGESWELADLAEHQSRVTAGPLAGRTLTDLLAAWGDDLLGGAPLHDGRFPLLIKFLDAHQNLSVQVHPRPAAPQSAVDVEGPDHAPPSGADIAPFSLPSDALPDVTGVKHEAWFILHAEPGAKLYSGLRPGVGPRDLAAAAPGSTPDSHAHGLLDLLLSWDVAPGQCFYLPSGTLHALGAGIVVAEVQTPSDITYRLYDWDRVDAAGRARDLHIAAALANIRYDIPRETLAPRFSPLATGSCETGVRPAPSGASPMQPTTAGEAQLAALLRCPAFEIHLHHAPPGDSTLEPGPMRVWILLTGAALLSGSLLAPRSSPRSPPPAAASPPTSCRLAPGDVALIPAAAHVALQTSGCTYLEVTVPRLHPPSPTPPNR